MAKYSLADVFNSASGLATDVLNTQSKWKQQAADAKLRAQQIDLGTWQQSEINKFKGRTDFENFEQEWNDDFAEKQKEYADQGGKNYYADQYTARAGQEMFNQMHASGKLVVSQLVDNGQKDYANQTDLNSIQQINKQPASQERFSTAGSIIERMYSEGRIDDATRAQMLQTQADGTEYDMTVQASDAWINSNKGATQAQYEKYLSGYEPSLAYAAAGHGDGGYTVSPNHKGITEKAKQAARTKLKETQDQNNSTIYQNNTKIQQDVLLNPDKKTESQLMAEIQKGILDINATPNLMLDEGDRRVRLDELEQLLQAKKTAPAGGTDKFEKYANDKMIQLIHASRLGENSGQQGAASLYNVRDFFMKELPRIGGIYGLTDDEIALEKDKFFNAFIDEADKIYEKDSRIGASIAWVKDYATKVSKSTGVGKESIQAEILMFYKDWLYDRDPSKIEPEEFQKVVRDHIGAWVLEQLDIQSLDKEGNSSFGQRKGWFGITESEHSMLARGMQNLADKKLVYTNDLGQDVTSQGVRQAVTEKLDPAARNAISSLTGVSPADIYADWKKAEGKHDVTGTRIYSDRDGNAYEIVPTDKGKHFTVMKNGDEIGTDKTIDDSARQNEDAQRKQTSSDYKNAKNRTNAEQQKLSEQARQAAQSSTSPIKDISDEDWQSMDIETRIQQLILYRKI